MTAGRHILVVDDELNIRGALVTLLEKKEYQVRGAGSAEEALEQLETTPADLVLTDLKMPGMGGMEFLRRLKQKWPDIEVLVITIGTPALKQEGPPSARLSATSAQPMGLDAS